MQTTLCLALLACSQAAQDEGVERERQAAVARLAPAKAEQIAIWRERPERQADFEPKPLLRWSNPTAGSVYGEVFLWTQHNRPIAVASIFRWYHPFTDADIEFTSLSEDAVGAEENTQPIWTSKAAGVQWQRLKDLLPEGGPASRLSQMRAIAKRFSARLHDLRGGDDVSRELRLLQQPVYRYADGEHAVRDGGLFAFVEVTDPEAWLLLEAVETEDERYWRYAAARMNADAIEVSLDDVRIAQWDKIKQAWKQREAPYTFFNFDPALVRFPEPVQP